jgi:beta-N-acetylhexosaminidase
LLSYRLSGITAAAVATMMVGAGTATSPSPGQRHVPAVRAPARASDPAKPAADVFAGTSLTNAASIQSVLPVVAALPIKLSERQLAGQRVIYSYSGFTPPASLITLIEHGDAAGVIFFGGNYENATQFRHVVGKLTSANANRDNPARKYPLLLMTDQEGGEVRRLPGQPALSEKQIGEKRPDAAAEAAATQAGKGAAANLRSYGLNVNLAPVLDVYRKAGDFDDQYQRSYSMRPGLVSALGSRFIAAQQAGGVAATAKHFPGLGAAARGQDTDVEPVTISLSARTLGLDDEYPYKAAIAAGVKLVMVSWAVYPHLGSSRPAGLSSAIVQGQLRSGLHFKGVTITDAIGAGALAAYGSTQNRALLAAEAGMELILAAGETPTEGEQTLDGLETGYGDGKLAKSTFQAAVAQILALRQSLPA